MGLSKAKQLPVNSEHVEALRPGRVDPSLIHIVKVKPLSVNQAWQGRRFKTEKYKSYERELLLQLQPLKVPDGHLSIYIEFGVFNARFDWDNGIKPFQDILQKKYGFDDSRIYTATVIKRKVPRGEDYIAFKISQA